MFDLDSKKESLIFVLVPGEIGKKKTQIIEWEFIEWLEFGFKVQLFFDDPLSISDSYPKDAVMIQFFENQEFQSILGKQAP